MLEGSGNIGRGFGIAPTAAYSLVEFMTGGVPPVDMTDFRYNRFRVKINLRFSFFYMKEGNEMMTKSRKKAERMFIPRQPLLARDAVSCKSMDINEWGISHCYRFPASREMMKSAFIVPDASINLLFHCGVESIWAFSYGSVMKMPLISSLADLNPGDRVLEIRFYPEQAWRMILSSAASTL